MAVGFAAKNGNKRWAYSKEKSKYLLEISQNFFARCFSTAQEPGLHLHTIGDVVES